MHACKTKKGLNIPKGYSKAAIQPIRVITKYRTPSNLPKEKAKLISQQTDKISQQSENWQWPDEKEQDKQWPYEKEQDKQWPDENEQDKQTMVR